MKYLKLFEDFENNNIEHDIDNIVDSYLHAAFWTEEEQIKDNNDDLDLSSTDFSEKSIEESKNDIIMFMEKAGQYLNNISDDLIGHNFWLTRNHHGAGFWDMKELDEEIGEIVTKICHEFKEKYVYLGDDGKLYIE
jgi:hypothetical protein